MALTAYICVPDAHAALDWYASALGAHTTVEPVVMDDARVGHCAFALPGGGDPSTGSLSVRA